MAKAIYDDYIALSMVKDIDSIKPLGDIPFDKIDEDDKERDSLMKLIFSIDPVTNLPTTDIGAVLNKHLAPEVLQFIKDNLQKDFSGASSDVIRDGISEDTAFALMRGADENREAYIKRVRDYVRSEQSLQHTIRSSNKKIDQPKTD